MITFADCKALDARPAGRPSRGMRGTAAGQVCEALLADGVVGSIRPPDMIRVGLPVAMPGHEDLRVAVARLRTILAEERWRDLRFAEVSV